MSHLLGVWLGAFWSGGDRFEVVGDASFERREGKLVKRMV